MSSGGPVPHPRVVTPALFATADVPFNPVAAFGNSFPAGSAFPFSHLLAANVLATKPKRFRQRVDAGEPRNANHCSSNMGSLKRDYSMANDGSGFLNRLMNGNAEGDSDSEEVPVKRALLSSDGKDENNAFAELGPQEECKEEPVQSPLDEREDSPPEEGTEQSHSNSVTSNSSSRRKSFHPQRQITQLTEEGPEENGTSQDDTQGALRSLASSPEAEELEEPESSTPSHGTNYFLNMMNMLPQNLGNFKNLNGAPNLQELLEVQRRLQAANANGNGNSNNNNEGGQSVSGTLDPSQMDKIPSFSQLHQTQIQEVQQSILRLCQNLKEEIGSAIDKVVSDYRTYEARALMERMLKTVSVASEVQQQVNDMKQHYSNQQRLAAAAAASFLMPKTVASLYPGNSVPTFANPAMSNLLAAAAAANPGNASSSANGIFPASSQLPPGLSPFSSLNAQLSNGNALLRSNGSLNDCAAIRKKRSKVTDSLRVNKSGIVRDSSSSLPASERSSPLAAAYFPPTMVSHPLYNGNNFNAEEREDSGENSDAFSDYGVYDGSYPQSSMLTPIHLRKAKLMFFYTRYPSSALLKTYFPDIRFNKNNTAQLVKWFSNFREFFYMQMEKYAKQALAEGILHRDQIVVSEESEIYKQLNQHYNRNNLFPPPPRLREVIEETLKEFFVALQQGRDSEPSWKKAIYKVINRMDDPIPEHFKHPSFMSSLE